MAAGGDSTLVRPTTNASVPPVRSRIWSVDFVLAWVINFTFGFAFYGLMTTMAVFAGLRFAAGDTAAGAAASVFTLGATGSRLFAGQLVDRIGRRRSLMISMFIAVPATLGYFVADSLSALIAVRVLHGFLFGFASTAAMAIAQAIIPPARRAEGTGYFMLSMTLATAIGPFLALKLVAWSDYEALFATITGTTVVASLLALLIRRGDAAPDPERARPKLLRLSSMFHPTVLPIGLVAFISAMTYSSIVTYLAAYGKQEDLSGGTASFFLAYAAVMFLTRFVLGPLQDRRGDNIVIYPAAVAFLAAMLVLATATADWMVVAAGGLCGLGFGTILSSLQTVAVRKVGPHEVGMAIATYFLMADTGIGLGPIVLGPVADQVGYAGLYALLSIAVVAVAVLYHRVHGRSGGSAPSYAGG